MHFGATAKTQIGVGNVPFTELPSFGSPFDLRGYYWGKYRDKTMAYGILEYDFLYKAGVAAIFGPGTPVAKAACQILEILLDEE